MASSGRKALRSILIVMQTARKMRAIASTRTLLQQIHKQGVTADEMEVAKRSLTSSYTVSLANLTN